jgi:hypothetical protein
MIFRNSKNEMRNINKLDFSNDRDYYAAIKKFMNVETKEVSDYDSEKQRLLKQMKQLI